MTHLDVKTEFDSSSVVEESSEETSIARSSVLGDTIFYQIREINRVYMKNLQERLAEHQVSIGQWFFLVALWSKDGITQRELSAMVGTMEPTTVTAIQGMERSNLVRRQRDDKDRRKMNVFLTKRGQELEEPLKQIEKDVTERAIQHISAQDLAQAQIVLGGVQENLLKSRK